MSQTGHLTKVFMAICSMFRTHSCMLQHCSPSQSLTSLLPLVHEEFRRKLERYLALFQSSAHPIVREGMSPMVSFMIGSGDEPLEPGLSTPWLLERLPALVLALDRREAKEHFDSLLRLYIAGKSGPLRALFRAALTRIASGLSSSDLFSRGLAEQLHIAALYPFSLHPASIVHGRDVQSSSLSLWQRMNSANVSGSSLLVVLDAVANLFRQGVAGTGQVAQLVDLIRGTPPGHEAQLLAVMAEAAPFCSFRHGLDLLDLVKGMGPFSAGSAPAWRLLAALAASKAPPALHKRLGESLLPFVLDCQRLCGDATSWPLRHLQFSWLAACAQFAEHPSDLLDHVALQSSREQFIAFLQTPPALHLPAALTALRLPTGPWPYTALLRRSSDPVLDALKRLERLLTDCPLSSRQKYLPRIEELLYHCNN